MPKGYPKSGVNSGQFTKGSAPWNKGTKKVKVYKKRVASCTSFKKGMTPWNKGLKLSEDICKNIRAAHLGIPNKSKSIKRPHMSGENHPNWIRNRCLIKLGDRNLHDPLTKQWRKQVKDRDGWSCRIADNNCDGRLEVHHILRWSEFPELRYKINNGITLCHAHHPRMVAEEKRLVPTFIELVSMTVSKK